MPRLPPSLRHMECLEDEGWLTPLEFMLGIVNNTLNGERHKFSMETRFEAAKAAAPYIHPKLAMIDHRIASGDDNRALPPIQVEFIAPPRDFKHDGPIIDHDTGQPDVVRDRVEFEEPEYDDAEGASGGQHQPFLFGGRAF